jgi:hypothetical protein
MTVGLPCVFIWRIICHTAPHVTGGAEENRESAQASLSLASQLQVNIAACLAWYHFQILVYPIHSIPLHHMHRFSYSSSHSWNWDWHGWFCGWLWGLPTGFEMYWFRVWTVVERFYAELCRLFYNCLFNTSYNRSLNVVSFTASLKYLWEVRTYVLFVTVNSPSPSPSQDARIKSASDGRLPEAAWDHLPSTVLPSFRLPVSL